MMHLLAATGLEPSGSLTTASIVLLCIAVGMALAFEFVNGFHDTANAVATVIYTHSLPPWIAVIWSGCWNLLGVLLSPLGVAFGVLALLPVEMMLNVGSTAGFAMVFSLLLSAIVWNLGTWYLGLPASSSHTLFGAIIGVGLANAMLSGHSYRDGVNWGKLEATLLWLLLSPLIGFICAGLLLAISKMLVRWPELFQAPDGKKAPPLAIRALLILTCTGVSYGHGSNDGQKGMGLILLILIGILPGVYALNPDVGHKDLAALATSASQVQTAISEQAAAAAPVPSNPSEVLSGYLLSSGVYNDQIMPALRAVNGKIVDGLRGKNSISELSASQRSELRRDIFESTSVLAKLRNDKKITDANLLMLIGTDKDKAGYKSRMDQLTQFIPFWVKLATALALGMGTMIGWKRIVVTVGEKIGKTHLTYAQGAAAELVAAATIVFATRYDKPVSTTHVLSSGVAGTMAANRSGLQMDTLRNLLMAWVLTLPVCTLLGAGLFAAGLLVVLHNLVLVAVGVLTTGALATGTIMIWRFRPATNRRVEVKSPVAV